MYFKVARETGRLWSARGLVKIRPYHNNSKNIFVKRI